MPKNMATEFFTDAHGTLASQRVPPYEHNPGCSGCPWCSVAMGLVALMRTAEYSAWLTAQSELAFRSLAIHHNRVNTEHRGNAMYDDDDAIRNRLFPENPYAPGLARLRAANGLPPLPDDDTTITATELLNAMTSQNQSHENPTMSNERLVPPNPYKRGLAVLRAANGLPPIPDDDTSDTDRLRAMTTFRESLFALRPLVRSTDDVFQNPPDPWAPGLTELRRKLKEEGR